MKNRDCLNVEAVDNSTMPAINPGFFVLRCLHSTVYAPLRRSKIRSFWLGLANCRQPLVNFLSIFTKIITFITIIFLMTGCSPVKLPNPTTYELAPTLPATASANNAVHQTLLVSLPQNAAGYDSEKMAYEQHPYQLGYFTKNKWVADPASMLQPLMVTTLQDSHHFFAVTGSPFSGSTDWRLDTTVLALKQTFLTTPSQIELVVDARLVQTSTQRIVAGKRFTVIVPAPINTPYGGVQAANQATTLFLQQLRQFVVSATLERT